jgi:hypothetical protein
MHDQSRFWRFKTGSIHCIGEQVGVVFPLSFGPLKCLAESCYDDIRLLDKSILEFSESWWDMIKCHVVVRNPVYDMSAVDKLRESHQIGGGNPE